MKVQPLVVYPRPKTFYPGAEAYNAYKVQSLLSVVYGAGCGVEGLRGSRLRVRRVRIWSVTLRAHWSCRALWSSSS